MRMSKSVGLVAAENREDSHRRRIGPHFIEPKCGDQPRLRNSVGQKINTGKSLAAIGQRFGQMQNVLGDKIVTIERQVMLEQHHRKRADRRRSDGPKQRGANYLQDPIDAFQGDRSPKAAVHRQVAEI